MPFPENISRNGFLLPSSLAKEHSGLMVLTSPNVFRTRKHTLKYGFFIIDRIKFLFMIFHM